MSRVLDVYVDLRGNSVHAGRLWIHLQKGRQAASFEYSQTWLEHPACFAFEAALPLTSGTFHTEREQNIFRCFADSAPDRWGRNLLKRQEILAAKCEQRSPRTRMEVDYLLLVSDSSRHGAFRFTEEGEHTFLAASAQGSIPPILQLGTLLSAATRMTCNTATEQDLRDLLNPGSSLGGARPKASVLDTSGVLLIAKFPHHHDEWDVPLWEYVAFKLAAAAGLHVPIVRLEKVGGVNVLLLERFDRRKGGRIPFASALTLLGAQDGDSRSYLEIADLLRSEGAEPAQDLRELWKRMTFNILISNVDDHLRNHGFLREPQGWKLSPVYDLEATPITHKARILHTCITEDDGTADPALALSVAAYFGLNTSQAKEELKKLRDVVRTWEGVAKASGAKSAEIALLRTAFTAT